MVEHFRRTDEELLAVLSNGVTAQAAVLGGSFPAPGTARRAWMPEQLPNGYLLAAPLGALQWQRILPGVQGVNDAALVSV